MKKRSQIPEKYKWDLSDYCVDFDTWEKRLEKAVKKVDLLLGYEGHLKSDDEIFSCLKLEKEISIELGILFVFMSLKQKEDATISEVEEKLNKLGKISSEIDVKTSFITSEIEMLSNARLKELAQNPAYPQYKRMFLSVIRHKPHKLSKQEEKLLSAISEGGCAASEVFDMFNDVDLKFPDVLDSCGKAHPLDHSTYSSYIHSQDRTLRKNTFIAYNGQFGKYNKMLSTNYISNVKDTATFSKLRKHSSSLDAATFSEEVSESVYRTLLKSVDAHISTFHRYYELKRKELKLDKLAVYDTYAVTSKKMDKKISYEDAISLIKKATAPLGEKYTQLIDRAVKEKWIDVYPNIGKDSGAFSWGAYGANPVVLTNFDNKIQSVFTLAHELGHCMHSYLSQENQPYETSHYVIFVAEVASTVNELLLLYYLLENAKTSEEKIMYYDYLLGEFRSTVFRQTMFAEFEEHAHYLYENSLPLSSKVLNDYYFELNKKYFGKKVEIPKEMAFEWSRVPHFYNDFYVYKYATGFLSAVVISNKLKTCQKDSAKDYLAFLSSGSSKPPVELLKIAGVNLEEQSTFDYSFKKIDDAIEKWEKLMK